jgi:coenzyme Q-binding protein COQ10
MSSHSETRSLPFTADLMYAIVADVEKYPEFLPWCVGLRILSRERVKDRDVLRAEMLVGFGALRERYISRVILDPAALTVDVTQTDGPFRQLETHWRFTPEANSCRVDFSIAFEFKSRLLSAVAGNAFTHALQKMTDAFEARAKALSSRLV